MCQRLAFGNPWCFPAIEMTGNDRPDPIIEIAVEKLARISALSKKQPDVQSPFIEAP